MSELQGQAGELRFAIEIRRKETGRIEKYELVGKVTEGEAEALGINMKQEGSDGSNPQHSGA